MPAHASCWNAAPLASSRWTRPTPTRTPRAAGARRAARRLGYRSKSTVTAAHVAVIHRVLTPGAEAVAAARRVVAGFEAARTEGKDRALVDELWIEPPAWLNAKRLLDRARRLEAEDGAQP